jgi:hypothetical protein
MADSKEARLGKAIDEATKAAQASINVYSDLAKEAAAQLAGDKPGDTGTWLELTTKTYTQAARDTVQAWTTYIAVLQALAQAGRKKDDSSASGESGTESRESEGSGTDS